MRKLLLVVCALALAFCYVGCKEPQNNQQDKQSQPMEGGGKAAPAEKKSDG